MSAANPLSGLRVGFGLAVVRSAGALSGNLGGVQLEAAPGAAGDGRDIVCEAVTDALLSACGLPDLETLLDPIELASFAGDEFLKLSQVATALRRRKLEHVQNVDIKLASTIQLPERTRIAALKNLAAALEITPAQVTLSLGARQLSPLLDQGQAHAAFAYLLCALRVSSAPVTPRPGAAPGLSFAPATTGAALPVEDTLVGRPREFEHAVRSKLPPLPAAPPPKPGETLIVYTDGASRGNPGPAAAGWVVLDAQGRLVGEGGKTLGEHTNNQAEYMAVQEAASWIEQHLGREFALLIRSDSELIVKQLRGEYKVKDAELRELALETMNLLLYFHTFELHAVPRKENARADALANRALDEAKN